MTDSMAMAGGKAMIMLGQQCRADGKSLPSRYEEARECLREALHVAGQPNLMFLTCPRPGAYVLNLQFEGEFLLRVPISKEQLGNAVVAGAGMLWGGERPDHIITAAGSITAEQRDALLKEWKESKRGNLIP